MKFVHCDKESFERNKGDRKILCFGASKMLSDAVCDLEILDQISLIVDNDKNKWGKNIEVSKRIFVVMSLEEIIKRQEFPAEKWLILITSRFYEEIVKQLEIIEKFSEMECYAYPCLKLYIEEGKKDYFYQRLIKPYLSTYNEILCYQHVEETKRKTLVAEREQELLADMDGFNRLRIARVVFCHWNKCNLNCEHCGAYMPDVDKPYHIPSERVLQDVALFMRGIEECLMVDITDGEPLLNPELDVLIKGLTANPKIKCVFFYSNGTYIPEERILKTLEHPKVVVMLSDYGFLEKMAKIITVFEKRNINFRVMTDMYWMDTDSMEYRGRSKEFLKYHFLNCEAGRTRKRMAEGKLWTCTRSFRFHSLGLYESVNDFVELNESDTDEELRRKILKLYLTDTADACNYCDYGNMAVEWVKAGIQKNKKIKKSAYTIIFREEYEKGKI